MEYNYFGSTGLKMSRIAFGLQTLGWSVAEKDAFELLDYYTEEGGNYLDLADSYNEGRAEEIAGIWLKDNPKRDDVILGTKIFFPTGDGVNDSGLSRKHILQSVEKSLKRLNTDYIDLLQIHCFDRMTPLDEVSLSMDILVRDGKIRNYGLSNYTPSQITKTICDAEQKNRIKPSSVQLEYSLLVRSPEWELLPVCEENNLGILAWSPLSGGWLSGKYRRDRAIPADSRAGVGDRWDDNEEQRGGEFTYGIIDRLIELSEKYDRPASQISLAWLLKKTPCIFPLIGARKMDQLKDNLKAVELSLSDEDEAVLNKVSSTGTPYPYSFINRYTRYE
ncbi:MAG: aldo/keto reductase [Spirochaetales bacterium]|uniref:Aldo/keto reductase n=1 Tax=Candidatus Thalassospirochaeta sargassi TaxID=3119039 RepID=A0AAJ1IEE4_9SPIO|nr:aldo/keto reductase [Spirochaetales bacterium]